MSRSRNRVLFNSGYSALEYALSVMKSEKPNDQSELDRVFAVVITDLQKALSFFNVLGEEAMSDESEWDNGEEDES